MTNTLVRPVSKGRPWLLASLAGMCLLMLQFFHPAAARSLYWQAVEQAEPTREQLDRSAELLKEHKAVEYREKMRVPPFHKHVDQPVPAEGKAFCQLCHLPLPHTRHLRTRAFMNMHSRFIACETCHFRPKDVPLDYRWMRDDRSVFEAASGDLLRTGKKLDNAVPRRSDLRIGPFYGGEAIPLAKDDADGKRMVDAFERAEGTEKVRIRAKIHAPLETKGTECDDCHAEKKGLLDFTALGATVEQEKAIRDHVIPRFFGHYEKEDERIRILNLLR